MKPHHHYPLEKNEPIKFIGNRKLLKEKKMVLFYTKYSFNGSLFFVGQWKIKYKK